MTCKCKTEIENKLLEIYKTDTPEAKNHSIKMLGYALIFGKTVTQKGSFSVEGTANHPLKSGKFKSKKFKTNMIFTYCPFCGERYEPVEEKDEAA